MNQTMTLNKKKKRLHTKTDGLKIKNFLRKDNEILLQS